jgi:hypothetical protein
LCRVEAILIHSGRLGASLDGFKVFSGWYELDVVFEVFSSMPGKFCCESALALWCVIPDLMNLAIAAQIVTCFRLRVSSG